jgi:hypothetical protein
MNPDILFTYERDGVQMIGRKDVLVIKKNGLAIEIGYDIIQELGKIMQAAAAEFEQSNDALYKQLFGGGE